MRIAVTSEKMDACSWRWDSNVLPQGTAVQRRTETTVGEGVENLSVWCWALPLTTVTTLWCLSFPAIAAMELHPPL